MTAKIISLPARRNRQTRSEARVARLQGIVDNLKGRQDAVSATSALPIAFPVRPRQPAEGRLNAAERQTAIRLMQKFAAEMGLVIAVQIVGDLA